MNSWGSGSSSRTEGRKVACLYPYFMTSPQCSFSRNSNNSVEFANLFSIIGERIVIQILILLFSISYMVNCLNLGSLNAAFLALAMMSLANFVCGTMVPMHPLSWPSIFNVTKHALFCPNCSSSSLTFAGSPSQNSSKMEALASCKQVVWNASMAID